MCACTCFLCVFVGVGALVCVWCVCVWEGVCWKCVGFGSTTKTVVCVICTYIYLYRAGATHMATTPMA